MLEVLWGTGTNPSAESAARFHSLASQGNLREAKPRANHARTGAHWCEAVALAMKALESCEQPWCLNALMNMSKTLPCATLGIEPSRPHNLIGLAALFSRACKAELARIHAFRLAAVCLFLSIGAVLSLPNSTLSSAVPTTPIFSVEVLLRATWDQKSEALVSREQRYPCSAMPALTAIAPCKLPHSHTLFCQRAPGTCLLTCSKSLISL